MSDQSSKGPLFAYRDLNSGGARHHDALAALAAEKLQSLWHALAHYQPVAGGSGWRERFGLTRRPAEPAPQGLYLYGPVGRGKSMLMDLFYDSVAGGHKRRVHFHEFMLEIHATMHSWRKRDGTLEPRIHRRLYPGFRATR